MDPYCGNSPRPEFLGRRSNIKPLDMYDDVEPWDAPLAGNTTRS